MVLSSQSPRDGMGRRHMVSRKRSPMRWPWIVVVAVGCVMGGLWLWGDFGGDPDAAAASSPTTATGFDADIDADVARTATVRPVSGAMSAAPVQRSAAPTPSLNLDTPRQAPMGAAPVAPAPTPRPQTAVASTPREAAPPPPTVTRDAMPALPEALISRSSASATSPAAGSRSGAAGFNATDPRFAQGMGFVGDGNLVEGRRLLSALLLEEGRSITPAQAQTIRDTLTSVNQKLVFSPDLIPGDPLAEQYAVQSGDLLARLAPRYKVPYPFIERINGINANRIRVGQKLKMINGPFHVRVTKREYRMDVFANGSDGMPLYICSFPVGLGEFDSTPEGKWIVERNRKVANPAWADPRSGQTYDRDDPRNPIGEYWIALEGADDTTRGLQGYGIHGTIEPESIGTQASMGCIRLRAQDIELVYMMLSEGESTVHIVR